MRVVTQTRGVQNINLWLHAFPTVRGGCSDTAVWCCAYHFGGWGQVHLKQFWLKGFRLPTVAVLGTDNGAFQTVSSETQTSQK